MDFYGHSDALNHYRSDLILIKILITASSLFSKKLRRRSVLCKVLSHVDHTFSIPITSYSDNFGIRL